MANIPGVSGYIQPGTFARDRIISRGVSIPGGLRLLTVMGLGESEYTLVDGATGSGQDGLISPNGAAVSGRFFRIPGAPLQSGRVRVFLNGAELSVYEGSFSSSDEVKAGYDCQVDLTTGYLGLQSASFEDQDGLEYSANSSNTGDGAIETGSVGSLNELAILDENTPSETWTLRCTSVSKDSAGNNVKGQAKFSLTGSVSGQLKNSSGNYYSFTDSFKEGTGKVHSNSNLNSSGNDGYTLMNGDTGRVSGYGAILLGTTVSNASSKYVAIPIDTTNMTGAATVDSNASFLSRIQVGDHFLTRTGGSNPSDSSHKITAIHQKTMNDIFNGSNSTVDIDHNNGGYAILTLENPIESSSTWDLNTVDTNIDLSSEIGLTFTHGIYNSNAVNNKFKIVATNAFVDETGASQFDSRDVGKTLLLTGDTEGRYTVTSVTDGRNLNGATDSVIRVHKYGNSSEFFPTISSDNSGAYSLVETNGILTIGVDGINSTTAFEVGDKFLIKVGSKTLSKDDLLEARSISVANINDPEFFNSAVDLFAKHGRGSLTNTLGLGAQMAFENGAPGVFAIQCKPSVPRKTEVTLVEERSNGKGGIQVDQSNLELNDVLFTIPRENSGGYRKGRPDADTAVIITRIRGGVESQIFPNKSAFYASGQSDLAGKTTFMNSSSTSAFSYTVTDTPRKEYGGSFDGVISLGGTTASFSSSTFNFDSEHAGKKILIKSLTDKSGAILDDDAEIATYLGAGFSAGSDEFMDTVEIASITNDSTVLLSGAFNATNTATKVVFTVIDDTDTTNTSASLLLNKTIFSTNTLKNGDGLKIKYIDQNDADFFDTNWFEAFEKLEVVDTQIIVPLPDQTKSNIFQAAVSHCETMSTIANRKERVALVGAINGVTDQALIGNKLIAVEDIGIVEGIQGDDPEEVLAGNIEDLQNFKLSDNFTSNRCVYFFPDQIVRSINGTNTLIDGFYVAAAAGGFLSGTQNIALPLTNKVLTGFNILRDKVYNQNTLNSLGNVGATVLQPVAGGGRVLAGRTTSTSGYVEDEEISIVFIRDRIKQVMRDSLKGYIGIVQDAATNSLIRARVQSILNAMVNKGLVESYDAVSVQRDKVDSRQINVFFRFVPVYPINYIFIDIEVGIA